MPYVKGNKIFKDFNDMIKHRTEFWCLRTMTPEEIMLKTGEMAKEYYTDEPRYARWEA